MLGQGDGLIHQIVPADVNPACPEVATIPFDDGPGGVIQDDIGALDADTDSKHLWAAGFRPVGGMSFLYLVNRNTGEVLHSCRIPFRGANAMDKFPKDHGLSGIDFEWPGLLNTDSEELFNDGPPPFATSTSHGPWDNTDVMEDITLCGFRATFGRRGNDMCLYP